MKILRVISSMNPVHGGPSQGIRNITPYLKAQGISTHVVCMDNEFVDYGISPDSFTITKTGEGKTSFKYNKHLYNWLRDNLLDFDTVIVHGLWQYQNFAVYSAVKHLKSKNKSIPPVFIMPHGMLDPYFQKSKDRKLKALRNELVWHITEKRAINDASAILYTCEEELRLAQHTFNGYSPHSEINIGYGIEKPPAYSTLMQTAFNNNYERKSSRPYWLFLSRIHEKKGVDLLINAYLRLHAELQDLPDLIIAGPADSDYAKEMKAIAAKNKNIYFPGMLKGDAKWGAFYGCEAFILPSHQENFGIAVVEAMACSKPVLISNQINIFKEIEKGGAGIIEDDSEEGAYAMMKKWMMMSESYKNEMRKNSISLYETQFIITKTAEKLIETINDFLKS